MALQRFENALQGSQEQLGEEDSIACKVLAGQCLFETKRIREGHALFQTALDSHPGSPALLCGYGRMLEKVGDYEDAMEKLHEAYELNPEDVEVNFSLGLVMKESGKIEEAIERFQLVVELTAIKPESSHPQFLIGGFSASLTMSRTMARPTTCWGSCSTSVTTMTLR